jgi:hypothetical protein
VATSLAEWDVLNKLLGTEPLGVEEWELTLVAGFSLFVAWEIGKSIAGRVAPEAGAAGTKATSAQAGAAA